MLMTYVLYILLIKSERAVTLEEGEKFAKQINAVFLETSAKDNLCVNDLFQVIDVVDKN